ncbi:MULTISPECIES: hypothetical protein [Xanthomarina]|uniref:Uncharacterized protein n=1 Tax=Xanthomarina gelatinilytica TaxID=1137281 RepID=M7MHS2_9FLAO|nr:MULTISPECIES: hypothetical protein [Xanthomarina]EMQ95772.1 hypothetical protein D778_01662 [Xanthomarina gelatinilytica]MCB0388360.1 hypothetical protein [Winogradskyella sp.]MDX1316614.1 hypothetical protein [Xanthomarina gelatinilytica]|tara:strand:+ start:1195 stop:1338 length:144 start_codon:yes stop_codon:yes gene_type:complete
MTLYIGPGIGLGTLLIIVFIVLLVLFAFGVVLWIPIKRFFRKIFSKN